MFRKQGGWKFNQHIRIIQRLVPRRQHFSHHPIHPSRSISPPPASLPRMFWDICQLQPVFLVHALSWLYTGHGLQSQSDSAYPLSLSSLLFHFCCYIFFWEGIYGLPTYTSLISFSIAAWNLIQYAPENYGFYLGSERAINYESSLSPWGDWCRILSPSSYSFSMPWGWLWINGEDLVFGPEISAASETPRDTLGKPLTTVLRSSFLLHTIVLFFSVWSHVDFISPLLTGMETEVTVHQAEWELQSKSAADLRPNDCKVMSDSKGISICCCFIFRVREPQINNKMNT